MPYDAIVIGAGPNGLVAAARLAKGGRRVLVVESADEIGGHTRTVEFAPGFRSPLNDDCGWVPPSVSKGLDLDVERSTPASALGVTNADGVIIALPSESAADVVRNLSLRDGQRWPAFAARLGKFAAILAELYQLVPPDIDTTSIAEVLPLLGVGRKLRALGKRDMIEFMRVMPMPIQDLVDDTFESEVLKAAIAAAAVRDIRQGPRSAGTTFNLLHYMVGAPAGSVRARDYFLAGPDAFSRACAESARHMGVSIRTGATVESIRVRAGAVTGIVLSGGEEIDATCVVSTADPKRTLGMVDPVWLDPEFLLALRNVKLRGCTAFVFFAVDMMPPPTLDSMIGLTSDTASLEKAADAAKYGGVSEHPHIEMFAPTLRWPSLALDKHHIVVARVQWAPYELKGGTWDDARASALKEKVTAAIARVIPGFESSILHRVVLTPRDIEQRFGVTEGALTQGELTLDQILFMRPVPGWGRYAMPIDGLFLGGAGAHPGPGILGGAGWLAAGAALRPAKHASR